MLPETKCCPYEEITMALPRMDRVDGKNIFSTTEGEMPRGCGIN